MQQSWCWDQTYLLMLCCRLRFVEAPYDCVLLCVICVPVGPISICDIVLLNSIDNGRANFIAGGFCVSVVVSNKLNGRLGWTLLSSLFVRTVSNCGLTLLFSFASSALIFRSFNNGDISAMWPLYGTFGITSSGDCFTKSVSSNSISGILVASLSSVMFVKELTDRISAPFPFCVIGSSTSSGSDVVATWTVWHADSVWKKSKTSSYECKRCFKSIRKIWSNSPLLPWTHEFWQYSDGLPLWCQNRENCTSFHLSNILGKSFRFWWECQSYRRTGCLSAFIWNKARTN